MAASSRVLLQRRLDVGRQRCWQLQSDGPWRIPAIGWGTFETVRLQSPLGFELCVPLPIHGRPSAIRSPRRELPCVPPVVEALDETVHPTKAQRFVEGVFVRDRRNAGLLLVED